MPRSNFMGLGRPTLRGVKKCPKCGTMNGTRGNYCKNKLCSAIFREPIWKKKITSAEACRINTGTTTRVYSVRVRDRGPDYRGFVQLPVVQTLAESKDLIENSALCFVDNCVGNFNSRILQCHEHLGEEKGALLCKHICGALRCNSESQELQVNTTVLEGLSIEENFKKEVRTLMLASSGPTVQRVSQNVMAVKCHASPKTPLGYLHVSFAAGRPEQDIQFSCPCPTFKETARIRSIDGRCPHFYACICAFVNHEPLREEFSSYITLEVVLDPPVFETEQMLPKEAESSEEVGCEITNLFENNECHVEILQDDVSQLLSQSISDDVNRILAKTITEDGIVFSAVTDLESSPMDCLEINLGEEQVLVSPLDDSDNEAKQVAGMSMDLVPPLTRIPNVDLLASTFQDNSSCPRNDLESSQLIPLYLETILDNPLPQHTSKKKSGRASQHLSFIEWLGGVTDAINQQMHYQFPGKPNSLVFQVHKKFFEKLKDRIGRTRRKHLTSSVTIFSRRDKRPVGTFLKHSWTLTSRISVKAIFDTPQVPLNLVRSFIRNSDGTFDPADSTNSTGVVLYKTYLRTGLHRSESLTVPFIIDWIPSILPCSQVGELAVHFEFGHVPFCLGTNCQEIIGC